MFLEDQLPFLSLSGLALVDFLGNPLAQTCLCGDLSRNHLLASLD